jgi:ankyrin repeat protein
MEVARGRQNAVLRCSLAVLQLVALFWFAIPRGLPLDDAWIHQVVARTFASTGTLGYAAGQHGAAATSYLWAALLAVNFKWIHGSPVHWAFALNALALLVTGQLLLSLLARRTGMVLAFAAVLLASTSANVLWYAHSGMEACLFLALSTVAVWSATEARPSVHYAVVAGVASGFAALTRPEGAPLCVLLIAYVLWRRRSVFSALGIAIPAGIAGLAYVGTNFVNTGRASPTTLKGRRWLWFDMKSGYSGFDYGVDFVETWVDRLSSYTFDTGAAPAWIMFAVAAFGVIVLLRGKQDGIRVLLAWAGLHTAAYVFMLPTPGHGGRYQPFVPLVYVLCLAVGTARIVAFASQFFRGKCQSLVRSLPVVALSPWFILSGVCGASFRDAHALAVAHIDNTEVATGRFVDTLPPDGHVASFDIGGVGWATHRTILDAGGLSDPATAGLLESGRIWEHLKSQDVRWIVLPEGWEHVLPAVDRFVSRMHLDGPSVRLTRVHEAETPFDRWAPAISATWNAAPKQVVYRIEYTGVPAGPAGPVLPKRARRPIHDETSRVAKGDRVVAEHELAMMEASGIPLNVQITREPREPTGLGGCTIHLGEWGLGVAGCDAVADADKLRSLLFENVGRYLDHADLAGAIREIPHVVAAAHRFRDPLFDPPLAPVFLPGAGASRHASRWGVPLALACLSFFLGIERWRARRSTPSVVAIAALCTVLVACHAAPNEERAPRDEFRAAVAEGDAEALATLLSRGFKPTEQDATQALHDAASKGDAACVLLVLRTGVTLETKVGVRGRTALQEAVLAASAPTVRVLLRAGSDANASDSFGETALHLLARVEESRAGTITAELLRGGADLGARDARGFTPIHAAAWGDRLPMLQAYVGESSWALLAEKETPAGETAVDVALRYGSDRAADMLFRHGALVRSPFAAPPLHDAARMDAVARAAKMLGEGANPEALFRGKSALQWAREHNSHRVEALFSELHRAP